MEDTFQTVVARAVRGPERFRGRLLLRRPPYPGSGPGDGGTLPRGHPEACGPPVTGAPWPRLTA